SLHDGMAGAAALALLPGLDLGDRQPDPLGAVRTDDRRVLARGLALRGVERRAEVADVEGAVRVDGDRHDVEATADAVEPSPLEVVLGQAREPALLVPGDRGRRRFVPSRPPALDLDEDDHAVVAAHEVDLARGQAHVALDDGEARALEHAGGFRLCRLAERPSIVRHRASVARRPSPDNVQSRRRSLTAVRGSDYSEARLLRGRPDARGVRGATPVVSTSNTKLPCRHALTNERRCRGHRPWRSIAAMCSGVA